MNIHQTRAPARMALALGLLLGLGSAARGQLEAAPLPPPEPEAAGFPWACFVFSVAALGGLYALVRRRQREAVAADPSGRGRVRAWYCRECDRDVTGRACPHCRAANPFLDELPDDPRPGRPAPRYHAAG